jgi:uncharacterized protein (TIGR03437 family)
MHSKFRMPVFLLVLGAGSLFAQPSVCVTSATPPVVRAEGLTERIGDILLNCTGTPGNILTGNISINLNANITNRISSAGTLTGTIFTIDSGAGPQPVLTQPLLLNQSTLVYNGLTIAFSEQGSVNLLIAGIRVNATEIQLDGQIIASISVNGAGLALTSSKVNVGTPQRGLFVSYGSALVCAQDGSPLPTTITFSSLLADGTALANTRVTEGFGDAFQPLSGWANLNADTGERILIEYSGFPNDAQLFIPSVIAGSDAVRPTSGGGFGLHPSGGVYAPSAGGSLLLALVPGANSSGVGGLPIYEPGAIGSGPVTLDSVSQIAVINGSAYAVYEVVDANPSAIEYAQYPTFLGLLPSGSRLPAITSEAVFFAPSSSVGVATAADPIPRFVPVTPLSDCGIAGDCNPNPPKLSSNTTTLEFTAPDVPQFQETNVTVSNSGGGAMPWLASISYNNGSGWLILSLSQGVGNATIQTYISSAHLTPNTYTATLTIDAGSAGVLAIPVTLVITAPPAPAISAVLNAASFLPEPVVPGSLTTLMGSLFGGANISATFNSLPATILFNNATQINLLVPAGLAGQTSAQLVVTTGGSNSPPATVTVAPFEPGIFAGGIANQDGSANSASNGAAPGSIIALWATGLSGTGTITGNIGGENIAVPNYAGPAPGLIGVQQVNLMVPTDLAPGATQVYVCGAASGAHSGTVAVCSVPAPLTVN